MDDHWRAGHAARARPPWKGPATACGPILMTAMRDDAGHGSHGPGPGGGERDAAPLGRAVIGGLVVSTFATLLIVPAMFALVMGDAKKSFAFGRSRRSGQPVTMPASGGGGRTESRGSDQHLNPTGSMVMRQFSGRSNDWQADAMPGQVPTCRRTTRGTVPGLAACCWRCVLAGWLPPRRGPRPNQGGTPAATRHRGPHRQARTADHRLRGRAAGLRRRLRADADFREGLRLHRAVLRGHRRRGEEGRTAGRDLRARIGRGAPAKSGPGRVGQAAGRAHRAVGRGGREQRPDGDCPVGRSQGERREVPGGSGALGVGGATLDARWCGTTSSTSEILTETQRQLASNKAAARRRQAAVAAREADLATAEANLGKAKIDVDDRQGRGHAWPRPTSAARRPCWPTPR